MTAKIGFGTVLEIESGTPGQYTTVGGITSVKPPGVTAEVVDATHMKSANKAKEKLAGIIDWGQTSIGINYDPADEGHADLIAAVGTVAKLQIVFPDGEKWQFSAVCSAFEPGEITKEGLMTASFTADVTGVPTFVAAP